MKKGPFNIFDIFRNFEDTITRLEERILELEERIDNLIHIERNHLIRVKNNEEITDDFILKGRTYLDLSPEKAWKLYQNKDFDFYLIDVSSKSSTHYRRIPEAIHIPWEEFHDRFFEIQSRSTPLLIISEDGTHSILACEFLVKRGYLNCNNVSGGYKFWKGFRLSEINEESA